MAAHLHKYVDNHMACFANVSIGDGTRVFLSVAASGLEVRTLHVNGLLPGKRLFGCDRDGLNRISRAVEGDGYADLPELPLSAMLTDMVGQIEGGPSSGLPAVTRIALAADGRDDLIRRLTRASNTPV